MFYDPGVLVGQKPLWSARTHGEAQHCPPPHQGQEAEPPGEALKFVLPEPPCCLRLLAQMSEGIRVWDASAGERHSLLLADGDCIQPIIYYSGQQMREGEEEEEEAVAQGGEEEERRAGGYTQQPVLLPFCMNVRK